MRLLDAFPQFLCHFWYSPPETFPFVRHNEKVKNAQSGDGSPERLSPDTQMALRTVSHYMGERGHAIIWAENYRERNGFLPTQSQIIIGLNTDLEIDISATSAARALKDIREREAVVECESADQAA